jgi:hypothetical protein
MTDLWQGHRREHFSVGDRAAWVVEPREPLPGKPWVWRLEFPDAFMVRACSCSRGGR